MYIVSTELGNNLRRECLIDPSIPEELRVFYFREVSTWHIEWETRRCRGKMDKTKTWWKTEREKNITSDGGFWNCLMPTRLIILHISLYFGDGCLSATVTGITMKASLFLLFTEWMRQRNMFSAAIRTDVDVALLWVDLWNALKLHWKYFSSLSIFRKWHDHEPKVLQYVKHYISCLFTD